MAVAPTEGLAPLRRTLLASMFAALLAAATATLAFGQAGLTPGPGDGGGGGGGSGQTPGSGGGGSGQTPGSGTGQTPGGGFVPNRAPVCASTIALKVPKNGSLTFSGSCTDPDGDELDYAACGTCLPKHAFVDINRGASGKIASVVLKPHPDYVGEDSMSYYATDGRASSNTSVVSITVVDGLDSGSTDYVGTRGDDELLGSATNDLLNGGAGDDVLNGGAGDDQLDGGAGNDDMLGGTDSDELDAGPGNDVVDGGPGGDEVDGGEGVDEISGGTGNDVISDTAGGFAASAAASKKGNKVMGGSGADKIDVRNNRVDRVDCGTGKDSVKADRKDKVGLNCERIKRTKKK